MDTAALSPQSHDDSAAALPVSKDATAASAPANALTPPTSEDMNTKMEDDNSSDLSDLDMDVDNEEDEEEITPDHYYGGGKIPVFKPVCYTLLPVYERIMRLCFW